MACRNTHKTAVLADAAFARGRNDHTRVQNAVTLLQESFSKTLNDRKELTVCIFFIFFKMYMISFLIQHYKHNIDLLCQYKFIYHILIAKCAIE